MKKPMMHQFVIRYWPGGMTLYHSSWALCYVDDLGHEHLIKRLWKATYSH